MGREGAGAGACCAVGLTGLEPGWRRETLVAAGQPKCLCVWGQGREWAKPTVCQASALTLARVNQGGHEVSARKTVLISISSST